MEIKITNVNKDAGTVSVLENGTVKVLSVVSPANIDYARVGTAEAKFDEQGYISYLRMQKTTKVAAPSMYQKPTETKPKWKGKVKTIKGITLSEYEDTYNNFTEWITASQVFPLGDKLYDIIIYYNVRREY